MGQTLTRAQLDELRELLEREQARIRGVLRSAEGRRPEADQEIELEEAAQRTTERSSAMALADRERGLLREVEEALSRMERGTYGYAEDTGKAIPFQRLRAVPWARRGAPE